LSNNLKSILLRHAEVDEQDIGRMLIIQFAGLLPVSSFTYDLHALK
jgi:hypothetical protein